MEAWERPEEDEIEVSGLDTCPFLEGGSCWWFNGRGFDVDLTQRAQALSAGKQPGDIRLCGSVRSFGRTWTHNRNVL